MCKLRFRIYNTLSLVFFCRYLCELTRINHIYIIQMFQKEQAFFVIDVILILVHSNVKFGTRHSEEHNE